MSNNGQSPKEPLNLMGWTCPAPLRNYPTVVLGHGSGGKMTHDLIEHLAPILQNDLLNQFGDSTQFPCRSPVVSP